MIKRQMNVLKEPDLESLFHETLDYFLKKDKKTMSLVQRGIKTKESFFEEVSGYLIKKGSDRKSIDSIKNKMDKYIWGYYKLEGLIADKTISDIKIFSADRIRIKQMGKRKTANISFTDTEDYKNFIRRIAIKNKVSLSEINAQQTFTDALSNDSFILRFSISTDFINSSNLPSVHIRKIPKNKYTLEELTQIGMITTETADYLRKKILTSGILICGKGSAGKTYLLNALLEEIPYNCSGLVVQENEELFSKNHPDLMFQHVVSAKGESRIQYTLEDLATTGLISDIDYFIVGEIKGREAKPFMKMANTGNICLATTHAYTSKKGLTQVAGYANYDNAYTMKESLKMLTALPVIVFLKNFRVMEISEIKGWDQEQDDFVYEQILESQEGNS